jgi:putative transposase
MRPKRLPGIDYTSPNAYFITICTYNRNRILADIQYDRLELSLAGVQVTNAWNLLTEYPFVQLDSFVVMPDHIHGIIHIIDTTSKPNKSLSQLMCWFKAKATKLIREHYEIERVWQQGFYDHIIRREESLKHIRDYIAQNPTRYLLKQRDNLA